MTMTEWIQTLADLVKAQARDKTMTIRLTTLRKITVVIRLSVVQQPPNAPALAADAVVWRTCVRQVAFVDEPTAIPQGVPAWHDEAAYAHLLEVVCGLHSPIVGETEVLHQFKVFADGLAHRACAIA